MARGARWLLDPPATVQPSWESWSEPWVERLPEWARDPAFWSAVTVVSVIVSVGGLSLAIVALPRFLTRVPPDYFLGRRHPSGTSPGSRAVRFFRNAAGSLLIALGVLLLVLPGPGYFLS